MILLTIGPNQLEIHTVIVFFLELSLCKTHIYYNNIVIKLQTIYYTFNK